MNQVITKLLIFLIVFSVGMGVGSRYINKNSAVNSLVMEKNTPGAFIGEVYDKIKENYWDNISDAQLIEMFKNASSALGNPLAQKIESKDELIKNLDSKLAAQLVSQVLSSLPPPGRSGLYTQKLEEQLKNTVNNVNPQKDLYKDLGLSKGASKEAVAQAAQQKTEELKKENTPQAKEQIKQITYANDVLTKQDTKLRYDTNQVEPTIFSKTIGSVLYVQYKKFSPTSYDEFIKTFDSYKDNNSLTGLIFDLRGNIGGAIDATPYFLGNFIGKNQYAYDFYHKGEYLPFKTPTEKLASISRYKQVVILVDNNTQSSGEIMTASLKKFHIGVVVGVPTKGWGTVERVFPLDNQISKTEKYSLFLVHSITLRDDNLPIEGRGIDPDINIKDPNWQNKLLGYFNYPQLISAVSDLYNFGESPK